MQHQVEYLCFILTQEGLKPVQSKVQGIIEMIDPINKTQLRAFIGKINHYRSLWPLRAKTLSPLTNMTGPKIKFLWTIQCDNSFNEFKKVMANDVMLTYPNYAETFYLYTDACKDQIGGYINQHNKPLGFFSKKLSTAQCNYSIIDREMLSITQTMKHFR